MTGTRTPRILPGSLILLRHGESTANAAGLFTGLLDVPLTACGEREARHAGELLAEFQPRIDSIVSSSMHRSVQTAQLVMESLGRPQPDFRMDWRLNERNYGALTGRTKSIVRQEVGEEQFLRWRRSVHDAPPPMTPSQLGDIDRAATAAGRPHRELGLTESLADVERRVRPFVADTLLPRLRRRPTLVVAHGNSLRALIAIIDGLDDTAIENLNVPTAQPLVYRLTASGRSATPGGTWLEPIPAVEAATRIAQEGGT